MSDGLSGHGADAHTRTPVSDRRAWATGRDGHAAQDSGPGGRPRILCASPWSCRVCLGRLRHCEEESKLFKEMPQVFGGHLELPTARHPVSWEPAGQGGRCGRSGVTPLDSQGPGATQATLPWGPSLASRPRWLRVLQLCDSPPPRALTRKKF